MDVHTYADAFETPYNINFSGIYRYPIKGTAFAPYGFGGFGRQWDFAPQWLFHLGLGGEFRLNEIRGYLLITGASSPWKHVTIRFSASEYRLGF